MWQYMWAHIVYHLTRWLPRNNRVKIRIVLMIFTAVFLIPQIFVLAQPHTGRYCGQHLLEFLIVSLILTFCMIGFSFLFSLMEPVPWEVKIAFHIFGVVTFIVGLLLTGFTANAEDCRVSTEALYYMSIALAVITMVAVVYFVIVVPFWIINKVWKNSVLDRYARDGICYEPVSCCSCVWHI